MNEKYTNIRDTLILHHTGYKVRGAVAINLWDGETKYINMEPLYIEQVVTDAEKLYDIVRESLIGNCFECDRILGASVSIYAVYSDYNGYKAAEVYVEHLWLDKDKDIPTPESIKQSTEIYYLCE